MAEGLPELELPKTSPMPRAEVRELIRRAQAGDAEARNQLIQGNLRLVMSIARRFLGRGIDGDDLFQIGCLGLVKAIEGFDLAYDVTFSTYAVPVVIGEIRRHLRAGRLLKVSRSLHDLALRVEDQRTQMTQELGRVPTLGEIAAALGVGREEVVAALEAVRRPTSLDQVVYQDEGEPIRTEDRLKTEDAHEFVLDGLALRAALAALHDWERRLVILRFFRETTQAETARALGVSQAHVSRAERRILQSLRSHLDGDRHAR